MSLFYRQSCTIPRLCSDSRALRMRGPGSMPPEPALSLLVGTNPARHVLLCHWPTWCYDFVSAVLKLNRLAIMGSVIKNFTIGIPLSEKNLACFLWLESSCESYFGYSLCTTPNCWGVIEPDERINPICCSIWHNLLVPPFLWLPSSCITLLLSET